MAITVDVFSGLLAFVFANAAFAKLVRQRQLAQLLQHHLQVETAAKLRIRWDRYRLIAVPEIAAAAGACVDVPSRPSVAPSRRPRVSSSHERF